MLSMTTGASGRILDALGNRRTNQAGSCEEKCTCRLMAEGPRRFGDVEAVDRILWSKLQGEIVQDMTNEEVFRGFVGVGQTKRRRQPVDMNGFIGTSAQKSNVVFEAQVEFHYSSPFKR